MTEVVPTENSVLVAGVQVVVTRPSPPDVTGGEYVTITGFPSSDCVGEGAGHAMESAGAGLGVTGLLLEQLETHSVTPTPHTAIATCRNTQRLL